MDIKTLKSLHMIVKYGSFHQAAVEMNYAQSTVTMQIQKLEADIGIQLLERGKNIRLTEAGRLFYEESLEIVKRLERLQTNLSDLQSGEVGHVRIGLTEPTASYRLPPLLKEFMTIHPRIRVSLEIASTTALVESLQQDKIDFACCSAPEIGTDLFFQPLFSEKFVALLPEDHPLSLYEDLEPGLFVGHRLLITSATCPYRKKLEMILQELGHVAIDTMEIGSMTALKTYVENGFGFALVPEIVLDPMPRGTKVLPVSGASIDMLTGFIYKSAPLSYASGQLFRYLKEKLNTLDS
ncbi:LysR family transcriptional regulator [Paenibacillus sp. LMG 31461]|uniref:LysR family transcriptional regulator n=1 Tax=Paenibacillus plantarum TaxID=2654975 RepID=A0ABX1X9G0_9BACL|nr:LysR family transcriptional regulator [Paenibacillus plantarum]NOU64836.1 LysR family transcriptional regulator [Paenibacillus plantarum]